MKCRSRPAEGSRRRPARQPAEPRHIRQGLGEQTSLLAWIFFSLWFGDYTGQWLLVLQQQPLTTRLDKAVCPAVPVTPAQPWDSAQAWDGPRFVPTPGTLSSWGPLLLARSPTSAAEPICGDSAPSPWWSALRVSLFPPDEPRSTCLGPRLCGVHVLAHPILELGASPQLGFGLGLKQL